MSSEALKILVCGDVSGKYRQLFARINQVMKKSGAFDLVLCVGEFFGVDSDDEYNDLIHGTIPLPSVPIYILGTTDDRLTKYYKNEDSESDYESGFELMDGITYLGRKGILTGSSGLRIAYFSGKQSNDGKSDTKSTFDTKDYESLLLSHQSSSSVVDILMTNQWPKHIFRYTEGHDKRLEDMNSELGSELVTKLSLLLRPRYHFVAGYDCFYERHPFRNHRVLAESGRHVTRFVAVAEVANQAKEKWLYAFVITPAKTIDKNELIKQPIDVTENPFIDVQLESSNALSTKSESSDTLTQFFYDLSQKSDNQNRGYNKRKRQQNSEFRERKQRQMDPQECWFCLASPQVEKHLIISIGDHSYLAMAKGGLTDEHLLILPIDHMRSTIELESEDVLTELNRFKAALIKYFDSKQESVVFFERNFKSSHLQIQCVSIPKSKAQDLKSVVLEMTEKRNLKFNELSNEMELKDVLSPGIPYFYMELPDGKLFTRINTSEAFFPIQLGRELLAHSSILDCPDRVDWKRCSLPDDEAIAIANRIRKEFESFDFTLQ